VVRKIGRSSNGLPGLDDAIALVMRFMAEQPARRGPSDRSGQNAAVGASPAPRRRHHMMAPFNARTACMPLRSHLALERAQEAT
jgi:hypothetical protein